jgi:hypothetical protein
LRGKKQSEAKKGSLFMPKKSKINLSDRALLKLAEFTISVIASAEAVKEAKDLPEKQRKAVEDMHSTYLYTFEQIQDVVFPLDCTQADVDTAMNNLAATIDKSDVAKEAVEKVKKEILETAAAM